MKKILSIIISLLLIFSIFSGCDSDINNQSVDDTNLSTQSAIISAVYPVDCQVVLHNEKQVKYLENDFDSLPVGVKGKKELSRPQPVQFTWSYNGDNQNNQYTLCISESADMSDSVMYSTSTESYDVYNLKIGTVYYWTVTADDFTSDVNKFSTDASAPRNLYVDGITNVRDLGGWVTESGTTTNQGLIYRCGRLNESVENGCTVIISDEGKRVMLNDLGIKTEIDVRQQHTGENGGITESPLGSSVSYFNCPMDWSGDMLQDNKEQIIKVFEILSDETNYPVMIHCSIGTDRTGMLSFLINALVGVPEEDLCRDYLFSNFGNIGSKRKISQLKESTYYVDIQNTNGDSIRDKTYNCLVELGVPAENIDNVVDILTQKNN